MVSHGLGRVNNNNNNPQHFLGYYNEDNLVVSFIIMILPVILYEIK